MLVCKSTKATRVITRQSRLATAGTIATASIDLAAVRPQHSVCKAFSAHQYPECSRQCAATGMDTLNKKSFIYKEILRRLLTRHYRFGESLSVKELSLETGISRQPIMSALTSLQERGFVRVTAQVGCEVISPLPDEVDDFYKMVASLEGIIAELASRRGTAEEARKLKQINDQFAQIPPADQDDAATFLPINWEFHKQLHRMARSPLICAKQLVNFELSDFFIVQTCGFSDRLSRVEKEHDQVIEGILSGDHQRAHQAAAEHLSSVATNVVSHMRRSLE